MVKGSAKKLLLVHRKSRGSANLGQFTLQLTRL